MDPLSITVSTVAILGALQQAVKCAQRLRAIRQAPEEIRFLVDEVADLTELLEDVQSAQRPPTYEESLAKSSPSPKGLDWQISRTSTKLQELDSLLEDHAARTRHRRLDRGHWGWNQGRRKANALREELRVLRLNLAASLGANTSHTLGRVETAIQRVNDEQVRTSELLSTLVSGLALEPRSPNPPPLELSPGDGSLSCTFRCPVKVREDAALTHSWSAEKASKMTRLKPQTRSETSTQSMQVFTRKSAAQCKEWCSCMCHKKHVLRLKDPRTVGSFSLAFSGLPWVTARCDQKACRSRSVPAVAVTFQFPNWMWSRYLSSSFSYTPVRGPEINCKLPRIVGWTSKLWDLGTVGDLCGIQQLFSQGLASPWDVSPLGGSLLHYATDHEHWDLCRFLVGQGATTETEDDFNNTPSALVWDKILSAKLSDNEASAMANLFSDTEYLQTRQFTILHKIVLRLIPRNLQSELDFSTKDLDAVDADGRTCVSWAAGRGDAAALQTLLAYNANPNLTDSRGNSPLHHASSVACIDLLINAGADVSARNSFGQTPMHSICRGSGTLVLLQRLVESGIDINAVDSADNETALANATYNSHAACALYLLEKGADMDIANGSGDAPVHMAIMRNLHEVLRQLLESGAEYTGLSTNGFTVLHVAARLGDSKTLNILRKHGLRSMDTAQLDHDGNTARYHVDKRERDSEDAEFRTLFEDLLDSIDAASNLFNNVTDKGVESVAMPTIEFLDCLDAMKNATITTLTSVSQGDEDEDLGHDPAVFFDAAESIHEMPSVVEIVV